MTQNRIEYPRRLSVQVTQAMDARLEQVARGRDEAKAEVVRVALRVFLDEQEDVIGSRKHFTKAFGRRMDMLECLVMVVLYANLRMLAMLSQRLSKVPIPQDQFLSSAILEAVGTHKGLMELLEEAATPAKTKPPAK
jgi:hypothetical protein